MRPKKTFLGLALCLIFMQLMAQSPQEIRLLVRADDIGSTHAANLGCIQSFREGIVRSVELMVPCAWFPEAVDLLNQNPGLDVGIYLTCHMGCAAWNPQVAELYERLAVEYELNIDPRKLGIQLISYADLATWHKAEK